MPHVNLDTSDAAELAELLHLLNDWLTTDPTTPATSLTRFVGHRAYDINQLRTDLDRFTFLLGGNNGQPLFNPTPE